MEASIGRRTAILAEIPTLDRLLEAHAPEIGRDLVGYRNHTYRVVNLCVALSSADTELREKIAIAAAFHDMGIWVRGTFDYLEPSIEIARAYLARSGRMEWAAEVSAMILNHHKVTLYRGDSGSLVETFRRADWIDVTGGLRTFRLPRRFIRELFSRWPSAGFHRHLKTRTGRRLSAPPRHVFWS